MHVPISTKCIKTDLCCSFADECTKFCTISSKLFNATIGDEITPWYTDVLQMNATSANNTTSETYKLHSSLHNLSSYQSLYWPSKVASVYACVWTITFKLDDFYGTYWLTIALSRRSLYFKVASQSSSHWKKMFLFKLKVTLKFWKPGTQCRLSGQCGWKSNLNRKLQIRMSQPKIHGW